MTSRSVSLYSITELPDTRLLPDRFNADIRENVLTSKTQKFYQHHGQREDPANERHCRTTGQS